MGQSIHTAIVQRPSYEMCVEVVALGIFHALTFGNAFKSHLFLWSAIAAVVRSARTKAPYEG